jgi:hypothetical protein
MPHDPLLFPEADSLEATALSVEKNGIIKSLQLEYIKLFLEI